MLYRSLRNGDSAVLASYGYGACAGVKERIDESANRPKDFAECPVSVARKYCAGPVQEQPHAAVSVYQVVSKDAALVLGEGGVSVDEGSQYCSRCRQLFNHLRIAGWVVAIHKQRAVVRSRHPAADRR